MRPGSSCGPKAAFRTWSRTEIDREQSAGGRLTGSVDVPGAVVVIYKDGHVFSWAQVRNNRFDIPLPVGDYEYQALAMGYGPSERRSHTVASAETIDVRIDDLKEPATIEFAVRDKASGDPLDARIEVSEGYRPVVGFLGRPTFFTDFVEQGRIATTIAPGYYRFSVSSGAGFTASTVMLETELGPGAEASLLAEIPVEAVPSQRGWYSADLHHHSDVLDGFSDPDEVAISVLASGTDVLFLSDHDSMINNAELGRLSALRGRTFISATELSPSYAHFNAYPIEDDREIKIDVGASTVQEVFEEARRIGADVIQANHPWGDYGYFTALELEAALGGYDDDFDVVEITAGDNAKTMQRVWQMWNAGSTKYLAAGSDVHDVYAEISGAARSFVHIEGEPTVDAFVSNLLAGHSYASQGPLIFPEIIFGSTIDQQPGAELVLEYEVQSVSGLRHVMLIAGGEEVDRRIIDGNGPVDVRFVVTPTANTWYALVVEDEADKFAYSNPVWINMRENEQ